MIKKYLSFLYLFNQMIFLIFFTTNSSFANAISSSFEVTASMGDTCTIKTDGLMFGNYDPVAGFTGLNSVTTNTLIYVDCSVDLGGNVLRINKGQNDLSDNIHQMRNVDGDHFLKYIVSDQNIDAKAENTDYFKWSCQGSNTTHTLYGLIIQGQNVPIGDYSDTLQILLEF